MRLSIELDEPTANRLIAVAVLERRPVAWQAEVLLRQALGCPPPQQQVVATAPV
ncbi:MAG: hypothetical protein HY689_16295 [Chloroflexi bacterium]|nr:hypothetical protein [Chloroflexota bacterium]